MSQNIRLCGFTILVSCLALLSCGGDEERQEQILKLRGLGVEQTPVSAQAGSEVNLTFHLAAPQGKTITPKVYIDKSFRYGTTTAVTLVDTNPTEEKLSGISHYTYHAKFTVPSDAATTTTLISAKGPLRIRYGISFNDGSREENIVGDTLVYAANADELKWTAPTITIDQPTAGDISSTTTVSSTVTNTNSESNRISWFVSSGDMKNRRAASTEWSKISSGEQTIIVTARGKNSGAFAMKIAQVTVH